VRGGRFDWRSKEWTGRAGFRGALLGRRCRSRLGIWLGAGIFSGQTLSLSILRLNNVSRWQVGAHPSEISMIDSSLDSTSSTSLSSSSDEETMTVLLFTAVCLGGALGGEAGDELDDAID
jgi:hypothetical protein